MAHVTATLKQAKALYEAHIGPAPGNMPYHDMLSAVVDKHGMDDVKDMVADLAEIDAAKCYYCGNQAHKRLDAIRGVDTFICNGCDAQLDSMVDAIAKIADPAKPPAPSCWGCGPDYLLIKGGADDLMDITIYGQPEKVCPVCYDELPEDYDTGVLNL